MADIIGIDQYVDRVRQMETSDLAHPDSWNPIHTALINAIVHLKTNKLEKAGGTMTGLLTLSGDPTTAFQPVTKQLHESHTGAANPHSGSAPLASPNFSGAPQVSGNTIWHAGNDDVLVKRASGVYTIPSGTVFTNGVQTTITIPLGVTSDFGFAVMSSATAGASIPQSEFTLRNAANYMKVFGKHYRSAGDYEHSVNLARSSDSRAKDVANPGLWHFLGNGVSNTANLYLNEVYLDGTNLVTKWYVWGTGNCTTTTDWLVAWDILYQ